MARSKRPLLNWFRRMYFVDHHRIFKIVDGVDIQYYFYRCVDGGHMHTFYIQSK